MTTPGAVDLLAVVAPRRRAADLVRDAWDTGRAVTVLDPAAPPAVRARVLAGCSCQSPKRDSSQAHQGESSSKCEESTRVYSPRGPAE